MTWGMEKCSRTRFWMTSTSYGTRWCVNIHVVSCPTILTGCWPLPDSLRHFRKEHRAPTWWDLEGRPPSGTALARHASRTEQADPSYCTTQHTIRDLDIFCRT